MKCCKKKSNNQQDQSGIKDLSLEGMICYCFKYSKKELYHAIKTGTENKILEDIKTKMKDPGCFCETANPSGKCCLGDINAFIKLAKDEAL